ncbi:MAG: SDR family NAD(P)-dependent oxidoreductase [Dehalococcoidales bacterium]|nr:SDR family NAD(P)-dependent oxidoreductase [Dehalococcoidales bacterium]
MKLEGKVAIVSGGGGIGQGIVRCLAEEGADVAVIDIKEESANIAANEVKKLGRRSLALTADMTDSKDVGQVVKNIIDTFGKIDILVNNVGGHGEAYWGGTSLRFVDQEEAEWDQDLSVNLKTQVLMSRAVVPYFIKQNSGKIINMSSIGGKRGAPGNMTYGAAKAAVLHFTKSLALELAGYNVNVNAICPGVLFTPLLARGIAHRIPFIPEAKGMTAREYFNKSTLSRVPLKREQTPEDIGRAVVFLVSEDAKNITGQSLNVDGGLIMD